MVGPIPYPALLLGALLAAATGQALAQEAPAENIEIGLSMDRVDITADFSGADLTIFGALDGTDPTVSRQGRYDVIVVLEGPARPIVVRRKDRILGMWINTQSETFVNVPISYSVATTRPWQDITEPRSYRQLALGADNLYIEPLDHNDNPANIQEFTAALRQLKRSTGLYNERIGGVQFLSRNLFRATVTLAQNVPVGTHRARAFLFRNGVFVKESSAQLAIVKSGFEQSVYRMANEYSMFYGVFAVLLAILTGWLGRLAFRRD